MASGLSAIGGHWPFTPALAAGEVRSSAASAQPNATSQTRTLGPIAASMLACLPVLALRRDHYRREDGPVFDSRTGTPLLASNLHRRVLKPTGETIGLSWVTLHTFRHTCGSLVVDEGRNVKQVQEWLGHSDPRVQDAALRACDGLGRREGPESSERSTGCKRRRFESLLRHPRKPRYGGFRGTADSGAIGCRRPADGMRRRVRWIKGSRT